MAIRDQSKELKEKYFKNYRWTMFETPFRAPESGPSDKMLPKDYKKLWDKPLIPCWKMTGAPTCPFSVNQSFLGHESDCAVFMKKSECYFKRSHYPSTKITHRRNPVRRKRR